MAFTIFNLKKVIAEYNKKIKENKKIKRDDHFGFESLSPNAFQRLIDANQQFSQAPQMFAGLSGTNQFDFKKLFIEAIHQLDSTKFKEYSARYRQDFKKQKNQQWYEHQQKSLSLQSFWNELAEKFPVRIRSTLSHLQRKWQYQRDYSHYNSLALKHVAERILPVFDQYAELAYLELESKGKKLPKIVESEFRQYLVQLRIEIKNEKQKLCWAMLGRLEIASKKGDLGADDVTIALTEALKEIGVIKSAAKFPEERRDLTVECFEFFHRFIEAHGELHLKSRLRYLSWFRDNEHYLTLQRSIHPIIVPKKLASFVPEHAPMFAMVFRGAYFRYQFFTNRLALMSRIRLLTRHSVSITSLENVVNHPTLKTLNELEETLHDEYRKSMASKPKGIQRLIWRETHTFIAIWQTFMFEQRRIVLDKKIEILHQVAQQLKIRIDIELDSELLAAPHFKRFLKQLTDNIDYLCNELSIDTLMLPQYRESKHIVYQVINNTVIPNRNFQEISEQEALDASPSIIQDEGILQDKEDVRSNEFEKISEFLQNCQQNSLSDQLEYNVNFISELKKYVQLIKQHKNKVLKNLLNIVLEEYFLTYLRECIKWEDDECEANLKQWKKVEDLLLSIAPKSIRDRLSSLCELASKDQWFLWKIKCQSYLYSFDNDQNSRKPKIPSVQESVIEKTPPYNSTVRFFKQQRSSFDETARHSSNSFNASHRQC